jgi:hypothetical protein
LFAIRPKEFAKVKTTPRSEAEARAAHKPRRLLPAGRHRGTVAELTEGVSPRGNETLRAVIAINGADGTEYRLVDVARSNETLRFDT